MPITVDQPESIPRSAFLTLLADLGLSIRDLRSLEFSHDGIRASVMVRDDNGALVLDRQRNAVATHEVFIRIAEDEDDRGYFVESVPCADCDGGGQK